MKEVASGRDLERFRDAIVQRIGLQLDDSRLTFLADVLQRRLDRLGRSGDTYLGELEQLPVPLELSQLAEELTVGETYFFRNNDQFRALADAVLPSRMATATGRSAPQTLRILSAGCASGEEAYSIAMAMRDALTDTGWQVLVSAIDINPAALEKARRGRYSAWALRDTPPDLRARWFRPEGRDMVLDGAARVGVKFTVANLAADDPELWLPETYDVVFCRNVLMYFSAPQMHATVARIARSLAPGGFLFLGHAETLRGVSDAFHLCHTHDTFYYQRKDCYGRTGMSSGDAVPAVAGLPAAPGRPAPLAGAAPPAAAHWFDTIREASERVAVLITAPPSGAESTARRAAAHDLAPALDLLRREHFAAALDLVRAAPPPGQRDPDIMLLEAMLLAHKGELAAAGAACLRLLMIDELNAGAHYVLALCDEHAGDHQRSREHDRTAIYLDPAFAMPRLHLGLMARRSGERDAARRELAQALVLLRGEDPSRLLLFGGGFSRDALLVLCESALRECGGRR